MPELFNNSNLNTETLQNKTAPLSSEKNNNNQSSIINPQPLSNHRNNLFLFIFIGIIILISGFGLGFYFKNYFQITPETKSSPIAPKKEQSQEVLKIGGILPLTTDSASFGIPIQQAAKLAQREINKAGGINGRQIEIIWKDGRCEKNDALAAAQNLINDNNVEILLAGACSSEFLNAAPIAQQKKILSFTSSATSPKISQLGQYVFRTCPSDALAGKAAAQYAYNKWNSRKAGIITENKDYTLGLRDVFKENFTNLGGQILVDEVFETGTTDFSNYAAIAKNQALDVIYILPQSPTPGVLLVKALKDSGITAKILTAEVLLIRDALSEQGDILEGVTGIEVLFDENQPKAKHLMDYYKQEYGTEATYPGFMAGMYDIFYLLKEAYESGATNSDEVANYLYNLKGWEGAVGRLTFDKNGDPTLTYSIRLISGHAAPQVDTYSPSE
jgi:branched-chain amino acid transport system substrate-binding protein